jgi:hypothetical protein
VPDWLTAGLELGCPMYFAVLRGKLHELNAVLRVAPTLIAAGNVVPIIEPVRARWPDINSILDTGLPLGLIVNPQYGIYSKPSPRSRRVPVRLPPVARSTFRRPEARPTFLVTINTAAALTRTFGNLHGQRPHFVYVRRRPKDHAVLALINATLPDHLLVRKRVVATIPPRMRNVDVITTYRRAAANAAYPADESFSVRPIDIATDPDFGHYGDYSIEGASYRGDGGGGQAARNVALHLIYSTAGAGSELRIRHYVSRALGDFEAMCREALGLLVADVPRLRRASQANDTVALREMAAHYRGGDAYSLGEAKEMAIRHHLELMTVAQ